MPGWDGWRFALGALLSLVIGGIARWRRALSRDGFWGAVLTGTLTLGFGGWAWGLALVAFFLSSTALTRWRKERKASLEGIVAKGGERDLWQVLANGGVGTLIAVLSAFLPHPLFPVAFAGSLAAATADTWATEVGVLSRKPPRRITDGRVVPPGTSGGVTVLGWLAGAAGAFFLPALFFLVARTGDAPRAVLSAGLGGIVGMTADSLLGATVQGIYRCPACGEETERRAHCGRLTRRTRGWSWVTNDGVNLTATLLGALAAAVLAAT